MNSIMTSDDASEESEFLSALNASLESFVHKALKDEQIECIHRIVCHGRDVLAVLPTGKGPYSQRHITNRHRTPCFLLAYKVERYVERYATETCSLRTKQEDVFYKINHIFVGCTVQHCM